MMAAILNSAMLDSDTLFSSLRFTQKHSHSTLTLTQTNSIWLKLIDCWLNLMMAAILNSAILNLAILDSATLVFPLKLTHTCQDWFPPFCTKKNFTHSFWLNLMMAAILNSAMLDSDTLFSSLRFTQKHSHSTLTLTQTNLIWLKLIHSHSTWWWQPSWSSASLNLAILDSAILGFPLKLTHTCQDWFPPFAQKKPSLLHSDSTWWWQPSWILPCLENSDTAILDWDTFLSSLRFTQKYSHSTLDSWLKLILIWLKLIHSDSTWWWQPSWILPSWIWASWIQPP